MVVCEADELLGITRVIIAITVAPEDFLIDFGGVIKAGAVQPETRIYIYLYIHIMFEGPETVDALELTL